MRFMGVFGENHCTFGCQSRTSPTMAAGWLSVVKAAATLEASGREKSPPDDGPQSLQGHGDARSAAAMGIVYTCIITCQAFSCALEELFRSFNWWAGAR